MMINLKHSWFPLSLAVILGGLSAWLERVSTVEVGEVKLPPNQAQYAVWDLAAQRFDETGSLKELLTAQHAWQLPDQKNVYLEHANLQTFQQGTPQYRVKGLSARYHLDEKKVYFEQKVVLEKQADSQRPAAKFSTHNLVVDTVAQTAQTTAPIEFQYGQSTGSANGAFYDHKNGKLDLPSKVKALIYDIKTKD